MGSGTSGKKKKKADKGVGFQFNAPVTADNQTFINGDVRNLSVNRSLSADQLKQLDTLFQPLREQAQAASQDKQKQAEGQVQELHDELSKGQSASPNRLNKIVDGLVELVPGALSAVGSLFASPLLGALVGPATKLVLDHIKK